ncbi:MAG: hypothetical protein KKG99_10155 [Bacteroidetes bacterium]|nr:hypothetical protein [Bacteroidota bacterium]
MKTSIISKPRYIQIMFLAMIVLLLGASCRVTLIPTYDDSIAQQIDQTSKQVDKFYLTMLELSTTSNNGRAFEHFVLQYLDIEVELNSLLSKNKVRPLNQNSTRICEITLELWVKYKEEHKKDNTLSDGLVKLNRKTFSDLFYAMQVAEEGKKIAGNPPK